MKTYTLPKALFLIVSLCSLITSVNAGIVYEMNATNSTLISNKTLTQSAVGDTSTGAMTYTVASDQGADKGFVGSASSTDIEAMNGAALTATDAVTISYTVDSGVSDLENLGFEIGLVTSAAWHTNAPGELYFRFRGNGGNDGSYDFFTNGAQVAFAAITEASLVDGFSVELTVDIDGWSITISDIVSGANTELTYGDTWNPTDTEYTDFINGSHIYVAGQMEGTGPFTYNMSEASVSVDQQGVVPSGIITWGAATNVSSVSEVVNTGALIEAKNGVTGVAVHTVNTVPFTGSNGVIFNGNGAAANQLDSGGDAGDPAYNTLLDTVDFGADGNPGTLTVANGLLTDGEEYLIQIWYCDDSRTVGERVMTFGDDQGNTVNLDAKGGGQGQFATGTFTADGTSQTLSFDAVGMTKAHITAYQIREAGVIPDPDIPTAPTNLVARAGNKRVFLSWDANTQGNFKEYNLMRSLTTGGPYTLIYTGTQPSYVDTGLTNGTTYYYVVTAVDTDDDESANSAEASATPAANAEPPNFLFIIADDMDTYTVNAYRKSEPSETDSSGNHYNVDTPNIDQLAAEGMLFHQARIMGAERPAVCTPSRACIMTGQNTWETMNSANYKKAASVAQSFPVIFNAGARTGQTDIPYATYRTCKGKNSYLEVNVEFTVQNDVTKRGNTDGGGSEWHADHGIAYLEDWANNHQPNGKPFFIWLGFSHPHDERHAREVLSPAPTQGGGLNPDLVGRYSCVNTVDPSTIMLNPNAAPLPYNHLPINEASGTPANFPFHTFNNGHLDVRDEIAAEGMDKYRTEAVVRNEISRNNACVDWIDQQLGRVLPRLEDPNGDGDNSDSIVDNTYIVFTADHGIAVGRHGLQGKQNLYEHSWRVPYIVKGPGIAAGTESDALIYLHETFPTFCDLAGIDVPATIDNNDGQSFRAVLEGTSTTHHDVTYGLYAGGSEPGIRAVTDGRFKLMKYDVDDNNTQVVQLFDLEQNPFELLPEHGVDNLALNPAYAQIRQQLEEKLMEQRVKFEDPFPYLGDRTLLRFEDDFEDRFPFENDGTGHNGASFSASIPFVTDCVIGEANTKSLDLEQNSQQYIEVDNGNGLNFGDNPFTIEAWVKLETLPNANNAASAMPLVQKKVISANDSQLDYMFLAAAGNFGTSSTHNNMALIIGSTTITSTLAIPDTGWHYISVAFNPNTNTVRFMLDGQTDIQTTTAVGIKNTGPLIIGAHTAAGTGAIDSSFDGLIDELSITDGFLDPAELQPLKATNTPEFFSITGAVLSSDGSSISLTFSSTSTQLYTIQRSYTLEDNSWVNIQSFVPGAAGVDETTVNSISVDPTKPKAFYRVMTE